MKYITLATTSLILFACSQAPKTFDKLKIELGETGIVPAESVKNPPSEEGVVTWERSESGTVNAYVRKKIACPSHVSRSISGIGHIERDKIVLCYDLLVDQPGQVTSFYGACPQDLLIRYELNGIPADVQPKFDVSEMCGQK